MPKKTGQDKHKHSVLTAEQNLAYRKYQNQQALKEKDPLPKDKWYSEVYKKK